MERSLERVERVSRGRVQARGRMGVIRPEGRATAIERSTYLNFFMRSPAHWQFIPSTAATVRATASMTISLTLTLAFNLGSLLILARRASNLV